MATYRVITHFNDKETGEYNGQGSLIEMTVKRADEINKQGDYLERVDKKEGE